jgi:hypothetical protein
MKMPANGTTPNATNQFPPWKAWKARGSHRWLQGLHGWYPSIVRKAKLGFRSQPLTPLSIGGATAVVNAILWGTHPGEGTHFRVRIDPPLPFRTLKPEGCSQPGLASSFLAAEPAVDAPRGIAGC